MGFILDIPLRARALFLVVMDYGRNKLGLNYNVLTTLLFRGWSIAAGGATLLLLPTFLDATEQGYYYTFTYVLALQIFFELGLNQVITQFVSHEVAHVEMQCDSASGPARHIDRLSSLVRITRKWYVIAAIFFAVVAGAAGFVFFKSKGNLAVSVWGAIWLVLIASTAFNLRLSPSLALLEGCGRIGDVSKMRLQQSILGYMALWLALALHLGLWAAVAIPVSTSFYSYLWLKKNGKVLSWFAGQDSQGPTLDWRCDILPMQWRIAVSWMAGYFLFNLFTPIVFAQWGATQAGKIGLALAMFSAVSTVGMSWVNATAPRLAMHISRKERAELNKLFMGVLKRSTSVTFLLCAGLILLVQYCTVYGMHFTQRIPTVDTLICLACVTVANSVVFSFALYMRAHKEEPMLAISLGSALLTLLVIYFGARISIVAMMGLYAAVTALVTLPWTAFVFLKYFNRVDIND